MYDAGKIVPGLLVFAALFTSPVWIGMARKTQATPPKLELPKQYRSCVEDTATMRASHMELLNRWRDLSVRGGDRFVTTASGQRYERSLTRTCLGCHTDKAAFCDRCHGYVDVTPYCWSCHVAPAENAPARGGGS